MTSPGIQRGVASDRSFLVFLTLEVTFILLAVGHFSNSTNMVKAGTIAEIVTAACAWVYLSGR